MTDKFQKHYVSLAFLSLLLIRILIYGASIGDSLAFLSLVGFTVYSLYIQNKNRDTDIEFKNQLNAIDTNLNTQLGQINEQLKQQNDKLEISFKDQLDSLQLELNALRQQVGLIKVDQGFSTKPNSAGIKAVTNAEKKKYF